MLDRIKLWIRRLQVRLFGGSPAVSYRMKVKEAITLDEYERALLCLNLDPDKPLSFKDLKQHATVATLEDAQEFIRITTGENLKLQSGFSLSAARQLVGVAAALFFTEHSRPQDEVGSSMKRLAGVQDLHPILQSRIESSKK